MLVFGYLVLFTIRVLVFVLVISQLIAPWQTMLNSVTVCLQAVQNSTLPGMFRHLSWLRRPL